MGRTLRPVVKLVADFETTVYRNQNRTDVWAVGLVEMFTEKVEILHSIDEFFDYLFKRTKENFEIKFHNLKFDGSFILQHLMVKLNKKGFKLGYDEQQGFLQYKDLPWRAFTYLISAMGQWYQIIIKNGHQKITITDSLKLLPFSVKKIGKDFKTKHQKLEMKYEGFRFPGCEITDQEKEYIANDVLVVKEALEIMEAQGHTKMTIGSCCMEEYKKLCEDYDVMFPNLYEYKIDQDIYGYETAGDYIRRSYKGGWCYLVPGKSGKVLKNGKTADVNSLYPSQMHSDSGNYYPVGLPKFFEGDIPEKLIEGNERFQNFYYFVTIRTKFKLKPGFLPTIQIKGNRLYKSNKWLETSDFEYAGQYYSEIEGVEAKPTLTLTCVDYELLKKHYDLIEPEILHGCYFISRIGIFDDYIDKYAEIKKNSTGAIRAIAKFFLNNLYGKFAASTESSYKVAYINDKGGLSFHTVIENDKKPGYIAVGSAITSFSRRFTITAAQENFHGADQPGFAYADTDSIHCDGVEIEDIQGIRIHDTDFNCWKIENQWEEGIFARQKTYIEKVSGEYDIKCAGMPENCKQIINWSLNSYMPTEDDIEKYDVYPEQLEFLKHSMALTDFKPGLKVYGKLMPKQIAGGTLLVPSYFEMRG